MTLLNIAGRAAKYFPLASPQVAASQVAKLDKAKAWMRERHLEAVDINSKFEFTRGSSAVLKRS